MTLASGSIRQPALDWREITSIEITNATRPIADASQLNGVIFATPEADESQLGEPTTAAIGQ